MALREFVFMLLLQAEGIHGGSIYLYNKPGDTVFFPKNSKADSYSCSIVDWFYNRGDGAASESDVIDGNVNENSARASRLSVNSDCSLIINNITEEDVGLYISRLENNPYFDANVYLSILTISLSPPDADLQEDEVTLTCSLRRHYHVSPCNKNSIRWFNEKGTELKDDGADVTVRQTGCVSYLTVKPKHRRFTCRFVEGNSVKIEAHYFPDSNGNSILTSQRNTIIIGAAVGVLVLLLIIIAAVFIKYRKSKETEDQRNTTYVQTAADQDNVTYATVDDSHPKLRSEINDENYVTYATVEHSRPNVSSRIEVKEEEEVVTYSAVKMKAKAEVDDDPSSYYS